MGCVFFPTFGARAQVAREVLTILGISLGTLIAGRPDVRGQSGYVSLGGEGGLKRFGMEGPGGCSSEMTNPQLNFERICFWTFFGTGVDLDCRP